MLSRSKILVIVQRTNFKTVHRYFVNLFPDVMSFYVLRYSESSCRINQLTCNMFFEEASILNSDIGFLSKIVILGSQVS